MHLRITIAHVRGLLLVSTLLAGSPIGVAHAQGTPAPSESGALILECPGNLPVCEGDGVLVEFQTHGQSTATGTVWVLARVTLQPHAVVQPEGGSAAMHYTIYVEEGTVGLTASVPVTCVGECHIEATGEGPKAAATPNTLSMDGLLVPADTEIILSLGDMATFEGSGDSTHVYRNAGETEAELVSSLVGAAPEPNERCMGRCLEGF